MFCTSLDNKFIQRACGGKGNTFVAGRFFRIQSKGMLQVFNQQFGPSLRASPYCSMGKAVFVGPVFFERSPSQNARSDKDYAGRYRGKSGTATTMEGGDVVQAFPEAMHDRIETRQEYVTSVTDSEGYAIESSLIKSSPNLDGNSKANMGKSKSLKYQPIIEDSCQVNSPANSDSEVKSDTHDSSPLMILLICIHNNPNGNQQMRSTILIRK